MTTPTPPTWMTCDHRGIGLPGCPTYTLEPDHFGNGRHSVGFTFNCWRQ